MSPQSSFFSGMRMTFSRSVWRRPQSVSLRVASSGGSSDILLNSTSARQWTFDALLVVNATATAVSFELDLSEPDILVPVELSWMFGSAGLVDDRTGRLSVECDLYASLGIQIDNDTIRSHSCIRMRMRLGSILDRGDFARSASGFTAIPGEFVRGCLGLPAVADRAVPVVTCEAGN